MYGHTSYLVVLHLGSQRNFLDILSDGAASNQMRCRDDDVTGGYNAISAANQT